MSIEDGCHRYGWIITIIVTVLMWAFTVGTFKQSVDDMKSEFEHRIERLERQIDLLTTITRGEVK